MSRPPGTDWSETISDDEPARFARLAEQLRADRPGAPDPSWRALHAKRVAGVRAEWAIADEVPAHARVGIFARPGTYRAYVRFSNGAASPQPDTVADVRGMAVKLLGVPDRKLLPGLEAATTQDFLTIHTPFTPFTTPDEFVWVATAAQRSKTFLPRALWHLGPKRTLQVVGAVRRELGPAFPSYALGTFYSALAIRFGAYAVRYAFAPVVAATGPSPSPADGADRLHADLGDRLRQGPVAFDFRVQFYVDEATTPIEDASREWRTADSPFVTLARLTLPQQDIDSDGGRRVAEYVEGLSFDPWHAPEAFRPLGAMMRARRAAYRASALGRGSAAEPEGADWPV